MNGALLSCTLVTPIIVIVRVDTIAEWGAVLLLLNRVNRYCACYLFFRSSVQANLSSSLSLFSTSQQ